MEHIKAAAPYIGAAAAGAGICTAGHAVRGAVLRKKAEQAREQEAKNSAIAIGIVAGVIGTWFGVVKLTSWLKARKAMKMEAAIKKNAMTQRDESAEAVGRAAARAILKKTEHSVSGQTPAMQPVA